MTDGCVFCDGETYTMLEMADPSAGIDPERHGVNVCMEHYRNYTEAVS